MKVGHLLVLNRLKICRFIVILTIFFLFGFSFHNIENAITPQWWQKASFEEVFQKFRFYRHFHRTDKDGRTLLMLSSIYTQDPSIPLYFIWRGDDYLAKDNFGHSAYDYIQKNPKLEIVADFIEKLNQIKFEKSNTKTRVYMVRSAMLEYLPDMVLMFNNFSEEKIRKQNVHYSRNIGYGEN